MRKESYMSLGIFIEDFERTEFSDYIHSVIGRSLIFATRFDAMCDALSRVLELKSKYVARISGEDDFGKFVEEINSKYRTLNNNINSFKLPSDISNYLHRARVARNTIAHDLCKGMEGCIDVKLDENDFIDTIKDLIEVISDADIIISALTSRFNKNPIPNEIFLSTYKANIVKWVLEE